jgi:hypothetical protein
MAQEPESKPAARPVPGWFDPGPWVHPSQLFRRPVPAKTPEVATASDRAATAPTPAAAPAAATETAEDLFGKLQELCATGRVAIELDTKRLMKMDSPVNVEAEGNQWVYGLIALSLVLGFAVGWKAGIAAACVGVVLYLTLGKALIRRRIRRRVHEKALHDLSLWRRLWSYGGVVLVESDAAARRCAAPGDNWLEFVRQQHRV